MQQKGDNNNFGCVLLVCVYNRSGNIIAHDYLYELFVPFGEIIKILIFEKAKVWKTFVEFKEESSAKEAQKTLNNKVIFEDGSKMNIFPSKLQHVEFQNSNLGGVDYESIKQNPFEETLESTRPRRSTYQDYAHHLHSQSLFGNNYTTSNYTASNYTINSECQYDNESTSGKFCSESLSARKSYGGSFNNFNDIEEQFREIAEESDEFKEWRMNEETNRRKSKTIVNNPHSEEFLLENCPSKVLFVRSIPQNYTNTSLYNIFSNFGIVVRIIFMKSKMSGLIEFDVINSAIRAKDELNYAKSEMKIFYSHYESLTLRKASEDEDELEYSLKNPTQRQSVNPPSQTLYFTMMTPNSEQTLRNECRMFKCEPRAMEWRQNGKDKWMCLVEFYTLADSLLVMGFLQGFELKNGRKLKISFTRSKINKKGRADETYK